MNPESLFGPNPEKLISKLSSNMRTDGSSLSKHNFANENKSVNEKRHISRSQSACKRSSLMSLDTFHVKRIELNPGDKVSYRMTQKESNLTYNKYKLCNEPVNTSKPSSGEENVEEEKLKKRQKKERKRCRSAEIISNIFNNCKKLVTPVKKQKVSVVSLKGEMNEGYIELNKTIWQHKSKKDDFRQTKIKNPNIVKFKEDRSISKEGLRETSKANLTKQRLFPIGKYSMKKDISNLVVKNTTEVVTPVIKSKISLTEVQKEKIINKEKLDKRTTILEHSLEPIKQRRDLLNRKRSNNIKDVFDGLKRPCISKRDEKSQVSLISFLENKYRKLE